VEWQAVQIKINKTLILLVALYGFETWSLTLREEHKWRVSENRRGVQDLRMKK
jgi:hypothetical protein